MLYTHQYAAEREAALVEILNELLDDTDARDRPVAVLYQDFTVRCRMRRVSGPETNLDAFRKRLAVARAGASEAVLSSDAWEKALTAAENRAIYWSRSRGKLWRKGEESGHVQKLHEMRLDCDADVIILMVEQIGDIACHTGRQSCFYRVYENAEWKTVDPVLKDPHAIYQAGHSHD